MDKNYSDIELINKYSVSGNEKHLVNLYQKYIKHILVICYNYLGKIDYHQDAASEIYFKLKKELLNKSFSTNNQFKNWLSIVVKNYCISHLRKISTNEAAKKNYQEENKYVDSSLFERNIDIDVDVLFEAIQNLNENQRTCILNFYFEGYKITDKVINELKEEKFNQDFLNELLRYRNVEFRGKGFFYDKLLKLSKDQIDNNLIIKILNYSYFSNRLTYKEISAKTGYTIEKVKSYIQNGRFNLKKRINKLMMRNNE